MNMKILEIRNKLESLESIFLRSESFDFKQIERQTLVILELLSCPKRSLDCLGVAKADQIPIKNDVCLYH